MGMTLFARNFLGDGLRDALDPRLKYKLGTLCVPLTTESEAPHSVPYARQTSSHRFGTLVSTSCPVFVTRTSSSIRTPPQPGK